MHFFDHKGLISLILLSGLLLMTTAKACNAIQASVGMQTARALVNSANIFDKSSMKQMAYNQCMQSCRQAGCGGSCSGWCSQASS